MTGLSGGDLAIAHETITAACDEEQLADKRFAAWQKRQVPAFDSPDAEYDDGSLANTWQPTAQDLALAAIAAVPGVGPIPTVPIPQFERPLLGVA